MPSAEIKLCTFCKKGGCSFSKKFVAVRQIDDLPLAKIFSGSVTLV